MGDTKTRLEEIEARANAATPGPWESDGTVNEGAYGSGEDCSEGFQSYFVWSEKGRIVDTLNSDVAEVQEEFDEDGVHAWDHVGSQNTDFIAHAREDIPWLIARVKKLEARKSYDDGLEAAAKLIEENSIVDSDGRKILRPRTDGDIQAIHYAISIRAMMTSRAKEPADGR